VRMEQRWIMLVAIVALLATGCVSSKPQTEQTTEQTADIFANEKDGILTVENQTGVDIVLFAGIVEGRRVLGGIRGNSIRSFDISKIENIPEKGVFIIRGVPADLYQQKNDRLTESDVLYTGLVVFDLKDTNKIEKLIPGEIDETMSSLVHVSNYSRTVCELRINAPTGPAIAVISPVQEYKAIWIKPPGSWLPYEIYLISFSVDPDGIIHESVPSIHERFRLMPYSPGGYITPLVFNNRADGDEKINLLFESLRR